MEVSLVRNLILRRSVFNPRNSTCGSARVKDLSVHWWFTDNSDPASIYIHACRWKDRTYHRVWPRLISGYTCKRIAMRNYIHGARLFWLYDANAPALGRVSRTEKPKVGTVKGEA